MNKTIKWAHCEADPTEFSNFFHSSQLCYSIYLSVIFTYGIVLQVYNAVLDAIDVSIRFITQPVHLLLHLPFTRVNDSYLNGI